MFNPPLPPLQGDTQANGSSTSPSKSNNALMHTLSRLSQSTSRPSMDSESSDQGLTRQTMKLGKEAWRRSGLGSLWGKSNDDSETKLRSDDPRNKSRSDETSSSSRHSIESTYSTTASLSQLRSQPLDTSLILYPTLTVHPPPVNHNILVLSLSHVSSAPPTLSNDELFNIVLRRLEPWVGEEGEGGYVLIILADEEGNIKGKEKETRKLPGITWWVWRWKRLPRKYRKNLKRLYIVRPSLFTRTLLPFIVPFISPKSYSKLHPVPCLISLYHEHGVSLHGIDLSLSALITEARTLQVNPGLLPPISTKKSLDDRPPLKRVDSGSSLASWGYQTISSAVETAASYLPLPPFGFYETQGKLPTGNSGYWGRNVDELLQEYGGSLPPLLTELRKVILTECVSTEGVFRRSSNSSLLPAIITLLDLSTSRQPRLPWSDLAKEDPLLPPKILSRFLAELREPIIKEDLYVIIRGTTSMDDVKMKFIPSLSTSNRQILSYLIHLFHDLSLHAEQTKMTSLNLAIVIAPVLISGLDPIEDTILCLEPDKPLPVGLKAMAEKNGIKSGQGTLVGLLELWIQNYLEISGDQADKKRNDDGLMGSRRHSLLASAH
ncbi:uncharacterized protein L201_000506 [Kwoniella dendrophila CBS 6074]|uniref:Rho-GAP domain-containing protein n=1 Tax=Kwoniella dendrophila CBS 6074 TaxID=1295534 RepID=A0AAX4JM79_9TREE